MSYGDLHDYGGDDYATNASDFGGGGFASPDSKARGGYNKSPGESPKQRKAFKEQWIVPVTVRVLSVHAQPGEDSFKIWNRDVTQVSLVGAVMTVTGGQTNTRYQIDDGTGQIEVVMYKTTNQNEAFPRQERQIVEGSYVRVVGKLRSFQGKVSITAFGLVPVEDHNEITHHALEVIKSHLYSTRGYPNPMGSQSNMQAPMGAASSSTFRPAPSMGGMAPMGGMGGNSMSAAGSELNNIQQAVLHVFEQDAGQEMGTEINTVISRLRHLDANAVRQTIESLTEEGILYTTIDENHYKCTTA